jgi:hypothetical protein
MTCGRMPAPHSLYTDRRKDTRPPSS